MERIAAAVTQGLDSCCGDEYPLARIAEYLDQLRRFGWCARDRHCVEKGLLRVLRRFVERVSEADTVPADQLAIDRPFCSTDRQLQELLDRRALPPVIEGRSEDGCLTSGSRFRRIPR